MAVELIFHNGLILTGLPPGAGGANELPPERSSLVVADGRIAAIGNDDLIDLAASDTRIVDLDGRTLLPGINDGHLHVGGFAAGRPPASLDVTTSSVSSVAEIVALVAERTASTPPGTWIKGRGWSAAHLRDLPGVEPTAELLDVVAPHHPVILTDFSGHAVWVNSEAMRLAGVTRETTPPTGGQIRHNAAGEPTGVLVEAAQNLVVQAIPLPADEELEVAVRAALAEFHRQGITSITDAALNPLPGVEDSLGGTRVFNLLRRICGPQDVPMRTSVLVTFSPVGSSLLDSTKAGLDAAGLGAETQHDTTVDLTGAGREWFNVRGLKVFADGVPPNCTSWMHHPYPDGGHGCLTVGGETDADRVEELGQIIAAGHGAGLQVGVHVTGDRATEAVVDGFVAAQEATVRPDARHYIIHGPLASPESLRRASAAGVGVNVQPTLKATSAQAIESMFGRELSDYQWPLRTIINSGCVMAASSDAPITTPNWRAGVATAMLREAPDGQVYGTDQRIGVAEAIHAYTAAGAWQDDADGWKGTIEVGKVADLCVVDGRLSTDDPHTFATMNVSMTVVGGAPVFEA